MKKANTGKIPFNPKHSIHDLRFPFQTQWLTGDQRAGENRDGRYVSYLRRLEVVDVTTGAQGQISTSPVRELVNLDGSVLRDFPGGQGGEMLRDLVQSRRETITGA